MTDLINNSVSFKAFCNEVRARQQHVMMAHGNNERLEIDGILLMMYHLFRHAPASYGITYLPASALCKRRLRIAGHVLADVSVPTPKLFWALHLAERYCLALHAENHNQQFEKQLKFSRRWHLFVTEVEPSARKPGMMSSLAHGLRKLSAFTVAESFYYKSPCEKESLLRQEIIETFVILNSITRRLTGLRATGRPVSPASHPHRHPIGP